MYVYEWKLDDPLLPLDWKVQNDQLLPPNSQDREAAFTTYRSIEYSDAIGCMNPILHFAASLVGHPLICLLAYDHWPGPRQKRIL